MSILPIWCCIKCRMNKKWFNIGIIRLLKVLRQNVLSWITTSHGCSMTMKSRLDSFYSSIKSVLHFKFSANTFLNGPPYRNVSLSAVWTSSHIYLSDALRPNLISPPSFRVQEENSCAVHLFHFVSLLQLLFFTLKPGVVRIIKETPRKKILLFAESLGREDSPMAASCASLHTQKTKPVNETLGFSSDVSYSKCFRKTWNVRPKTMIMAKCEEEIQSLETFPWMSFRAKNVSMLWGKWSSSLLNFNHSGVTEVPK